MLQAPQWHTLWAAQFHDHEPIHVLEGRGVLAAIKHKSRDSRCHGKRVLVLGDNMSCTLAFAKGRCGCHELLVLNRRIAAECLATGIRVLPRWVPSESNIMDGPSRTWEPKRPKSLAADQSVWRHGGRVAEAGANPSADGGPWPVDAGQLELGALDKTSGPGLDSRGGDGAGPHAWGEGLPQPGRPHAASKSEAREESQPLERRW